MNKLSKLTALLLAIVLVLGVPMAVFAESAEIETKSEYQDVADALLQLKIMAYTSYGEYWDFARLISESDFETFFFGLSEAEQNQMAAYVEAMFWDSLIAYTRVAPIHAQAEEVQPASTFSVQTRNSDVAAVAETDNGLYTNKTVTGPDDNGYYTITLENYATGTVTTTTTTTTKPVDIVLVLDLSQSMSQSFDSDSDTSGSSEYVEVEGELDQTQTYYIQRSNGGYREVTWCEDCKAWTYNCQDSNWGHRSGTTYDPDSTTFYTIKKDETEDSGDTTIPSDATKIEALQIAVNNFIQNVNDQYTDTANHRISIVSYNSSATVRNDWTYASDANLTDLKMTDDERSSWQSTGTNTHLGLASALTQLNALGNDTTRQKVVVLFTDGVPGTSQGNFDESAAVTAVTNAGSIKDAGAIVYSVAVLTGADPIATIDTSATEDNTKINAMLHAISSNYPDAQASASGSTLNTTLGTINPLADTDGNGVINDGDKSYYLTADSPASLNNIFQQISSSIQTGQSVVKLDETTIVRDVVTPYFEIPYVLNADTKDYTAAQITIQEALHTGDDANGNPLFGTATDANYAYTIDGNQLDVTGFDFSENAVMTLTNNGTPSYVGKKLIITFKIKAVEGFLGGNDVVTNTGASGVYEVTTDTTTGTTTEKIFEAYPIPDVDVSIWEIEVVGKHQHIFLSNEADVNELLQSFSLRYTKAGGTESYEVNGIRNDYATLKFTLTAESGHKMVYTISPGDTAGIWTYETASGDPITEFDVTPFLTKDAAYTISYDVIPIAKTDGSTGVAATTGSLDVEVHVYKPTFTFQDSIEDYLASETAEGYYSRNNYVGDNGNGIYRETWSHTYYDALKVTIFVADDGTLSYKVIAVDEDGNPILNADGAEVSLGSDDDWDMENETINFKGYGSTADQTYNVKMSGLKPTVEFTYSPVETDWINNGQVSAVECVDVNVKQVKLTSTNTHKKTVLSSDGALTAETYTTTSVYTEGSGSASASITVNDGTGTTSTPTVTGTPHITTKRIECTCSFCATTDNKVDSTDIHSDSTLEFVVHIKNAFSELMVVKTGLSVGESAIFTVSGKIPDGTAAGKDQTWTVVLTKTDENEPAVTITGLLVNSTATVIELGDWSWRYASTTYNPTSGSVTIIPKNGENYPATVTITNTGRTDQWLSDESAVENEFTTVSTATTN